MIVGFAEIAKENVLPLITKLAKKAELRGYAFPRGHGLGLLIERYAGLEQAADLLSRVVGEKLEFQALDGGVFPELPPLEVIEVAAVPPDRSVHLDRADTNGNLRGWAIQPDAGFARVRVSVDGNPVGEAAADLFRLDLLKAGLGHGAHGFKCRLPDEYLDGQFHEVDVEEIVSGVRHRRVLALPFHFNLPRPWVAQQPLATDWTAQDEIWLQAARNELIFGGADFQTVGEIVEKRPSAIFRDLGLQEAYARSGRKMPTFRFRLYRRWERLYGPHHCRIPNCCKQRVIGFKGSASENIFDECPLFLRHFSSKLLMKAFADRCGARTPQTLAIISDVAEFDGVEFPTRFVLKPEKDSGQAVFLMHGDLNLYDGLRYTKADLRRKVGEYFARRPGGRYLVEDFLIQEGTESSQPFVPLDYKMHAFGGKVRIIHVDDRNTVSRDPFHRRQAWLSRDWISAPFRMRIAEPEMEPIRRPGCFETMLNIADTIAGRIQDYIRVDLYATDEGPVLGELTIQSHGGVGFTDFGAVVLAQAWTIFGEGRPADEEDLPAAPTVVGPCR